MEIPKIYSKGASLEFQNRFKEEVKEKSEFGRRQLEGELEKDKEFVALVKEINKILEREFIKLGIADKWKDFEIDRIHILSEELIRKYFNDSSSVYNGMNNVIAIKPPVNYSTVIHEMIHAVAYKSMLIYKNSDRLNNRSGFSLSRMYDGESETFFRGFNEGFTDLLTSKIVTEEHEHIENSLGVSENKFLSKNWYYDQCNIINIIIEKIAEKRDCRYEEVFDEWEKKYFTGGLYFLRELEDVFGTGAMDIIAHMDKSMSEKTYFAIESFFSTDDLEKRKEIYREMKDNNFKLED